MEYFVRVFIKSEDDLPKEDGDYFCCRNGFTTVQHLLVNPPNKSYMREIRWYLKPVEFPEITDEEIEKEAERLGEREDSNKQKFIDGNYFEGFIDCAKWYRSELKKRMTK